MGSEHQGENLEKDSNRGVPTIAALERDSDVSESWEMGRLYRVLWGPFSLVRNAAAHKALTWGTIGHALSRGHPHVPNSVDLHSRRNISPCPAGLGMAETHS